MSDKNRFQEMLKDILEVARVQGNILSMEEIKALFGDIELNDMQYEHVYAYLSAHQIKIQGYIGNSKEYSEALEKEAREEGDAGIEDSDSVEEGFESQDMESENEGEMIFNAKKKKSFQPTEKDSIYLKMYLEDLSAIEGTTPEEEAILIQKIRRNDSVAKNRLVESKLIDVVEIAKEYVGRGLTLEDLIQEGNIGLLTGVEQISCILDDRVQNSSFVLDYAKQFIEDAIAEQGESHSFEENAIKRTKYLNGLANDLAEDLGRAPTLHEISKYAKLTEQEVIDILNMSVDAVKVEISHTHDENIQ